MINETKALSIIDSYQPEQIELIKNLSAKGTTNDEFKLFLYVAKSTGLDPLTKQIYAIKRWSAKDKREVMSIQTGIDGLRSIADRTHEYAPGKAPEFAEENGKIKSATAFVKKLVGGVWHEVSAVAHFDEYRQLDRDGNLTKFWKEKPHIMLAKCAEALALRKAFPGQTANLYTPEEMGNVVDVEAEVIREEKKESAPVEPENKTAMLPPPETKKNDKKEEGEVHSILDWTKIDKVLPMKNDRTGKKFYQLVCGDQVLYGDKIADMETLIAAQAKDQQVKVQFNGASATKRIVAIKVK